MKVSNTAHLVNANHGLEAAAQVIVEDFVHAALRHGTVDVVDEGDDGATIVFEYDEGDYVHD